MVPLLRIEGEHRGQVNLCWEAQVILQAAGLGLVVRAVEVGVVGQGVGALLQPGWFGLGISMDKKIIWSIDTVYLWVIFLYGKNTYHESI